MTSLTIVKRNYLKSIRSYTVLMVVALLLAGYYSFIQYQKLTAVTDALVQEQALLTTLQGAEPKIAQQYTDLKKAFDAKFAAVYNSLQSVYPSRESYTDLARLIDQFFQENNTSTNPVFVSDLKFGLPRMDSDKDYAVLPVTLTLTGTRDNFIKFLKFVQNSGVLADKTRLMDVSAISMNFSSATAPERVVGTQQIAPSEALLNVSISLNAYFQKMNAPTPSANATSASNSGSGGSTTTFQLTQ